MARDLLSPKGMRRLLADVLAAPEGVDAIPEPGAFPEFVICASGKHDVEVGKDCARCETECAHGCSLPGDPDCKGRLP